MSRSSYTDPFGQRGETSQRRAWPGTRVARPRSVKKIFCLAFCAACGSPATTNGTMPWLHDFAASATSNDETLAASDRLARFVESREDVDNGALQVTADVAATDGLETVLASYHQGVAVVDRTGTLVARVPGFEPGGSADDLVALSVGDAGIGTPVIALAVNRGGHRESVTSMILYRVDRGQLEPLFDMPIEVHDGADTFTGTITFVPGGLIYRAPRASGVTVWILDTPRGRYLERGAITST